jgi:hypothetical protein
VRFSGSVSQLRAWLGDANFAEQRKETELARQHAENAYTILELHRSEHGCRGAAIRLPTLPE